MLCAGEEGCSRRRGGLLSEIANLERRSAATPAHPFADIYIESRIREKALDDVEVIARDSVVEGRRLVLARKFRRVWASNLLSRSREHRTYKGQRLDVDALSGK